jgi:hypothetical protein
MKTAPAALAATMTSRGTSNLLGILNFQRSQFSSKKPLMKPNLPTLTMLSLIVNELYVCGRFQKGI